MKVSSTLSLTVNSLEVTTLAEIKSAHNTSTRTAALANATGTLKYKRSQLSLHFVADLALFILKYYIIVTPRGFGVLGILLSLTHRTENLGFPRSVVMKGRIKVFRYKLQSICISFPCTQKCPSRTLFQHPMLRSRPERVSGNRRGT